jgi:hypothetical protein
MASSRVPDDRLALDLDAFIAEHHAGILVGTGDASPWPWHQPVTLGAIATHECIPVSISSKSQPSVGGEEIW